MSKVSKLSKAALKVSVRLVIYTILFVGVWFGVKEAYRFGHDIFYDQAVDNEPGKDVQVTVTEGLEAGDVAGVLYDKGLIKNKLAYRLQAKFFNYSVKAGTYTLNTSQTIRQLLQAINSGEDNESESKERNTGNSGEKSN